MPDNDLHYRNTGAERKSAGATVAIFADSDVARQEAMHDAESSGSHVVVAAALEAMLNDGAHPPADIVICDCPGITPELCDALARFDQRSARLGQHVIVSTTTASLDAVFGCFTVCNPQILVAAGRAERLVALGRAMASASRNHLREMGDDDRILLLRLTEQVDRLAERLDAAQSPFTPPAQESAFRFESPASGYRGEGGDASDRLARTARPALPEPRLVRRIIRQRHLRARFFEGDLFADPAWDMLLDLTAARAEHQRVSVTSLCIASGVPPTTALRWIGQMTDAGLLERVQDEADRRRAFIAITDMAADAMARYFAEMGREGRDFI